MLTKDPKKRISIEDALMHPFFTKNGGSKKLSIQNFGKDIQLQEEKEKLKKNMPATDAKNKIFTVP